MRKPAILLLMFVLLTFFTCDNEPVYREFIENSQCTVAVNNSLDATINFGAITPNDTNYSEVCENYKGALLAQIETCGDIDGTIQLIIDDLDCSVIILPDDCDEANDAVALALAEFSSANGLNYTARCNTLKTALETKIEVCGDSDGSIQAEIDDLEDCRNGNVTQDNHALMTANLNGEQFNDLKPNGYNIINQAATYVYFATSEEAYLKIQGSSTYTEINVTPSTKEINIFIPESYWAEGTYPLTVSGDIAEAGSLPYYAILYWNDDEYFQSYGLEAGATMTITEFDLVNRVIKGTFEFQFMRANNTGDLVIGPLNCLNGTFDYALDDEYFD